MTTKANAIEIYPCQMPRLFLLSARRGAKMPRADVRFVAVPLREGSNTIPEGFQENSLA
jgi:hypothetical protein